MTDAEMTGADRALWTVVDNEPYRKQPRDAQRRIAAGADVNCQRLGNFDPSTGWRETPLLIATNRGSPELVKRLLEHGADTGLLTIFGERTFLHMTAIYDRHAVAGVLVEAGASLEQKDTINGCNKHSRSSGASVGSHAHLEANLRGAAEDAVFNAKIYC